MSGVREGLLPVQDAGGPQNTTHAGQGTEASQDQMSHSASRGGRGHWKNTTKDNNSQRGRALCFRGNTPQGCNISPANSERNKTEISLSGEVYT